MSEKSKSINLNPTFTTSMIAGASAGIVVDLVLYPLDTIKTRLQSKQGFFKTGGFTQIYKGLLPVILGSGPTAAVFFITYNSLINKWKKLDKKDSSWELIVHVSAASCAEVASATLRVPVEVVKQRKQVSPKTVTNLDIIRSTMCREGVRGMYQGFFSTLTREVPFAAIQFPLWEFFKKYIQKNYLNGEMCTPFQTACCGAFAGGCAAAATTPNDVIKTRIMLADTQTIRKIKTNVWIFVGREVVREAGWRGLFRGIIPRVLWITLGGFVFFGVYEQIKVICDIMDDNNPKLSPHDVITAEIDKR